MMRRILHYSINRETLACSKPYSRTKDWTSSPMGVSATTSNGANVKRSIRRDPCLGGHIEVLSLTSLVAKKENQNDSCRYSHICRACALT